MAGMCPKCGSALANDRASFCSQCGWSADEYQEPAMDQARGQSPLVGSPVETQDFASQPQGDDRDTRGPSGPAKQDLGGRSSGDAKSCVSTGQGDVNRTRPPGGLRLGINVNQFYMEGFSGVIHLRAENLGGEGYDLVELALVGDVPVRERAFEFVLGAGESKERRFQLGKLGSAGPQALSFRVKTTQGQQIRQYRADVTLHVLERIGSAREILLHTGDMQLGASSEKFNIGGVINIDIQNKIDQGQIKTANELMTEIGGSTPAFKPLDLEPVTANVVRKRKQVSPWVMGITALFVVLIAVAINWHRPGSNDGPAVKPTPAPVDQPVAQPAAQALVRPVQEPAVQPVPEPVLQPASVPDTGEKPTDTTVQAAPSTPSHRARIDNDLINAVNTPPGFVVQIRTADGKRTYTEGEYISFIVEATRDCYVTLITVDPEGQMTLLLPNAWQQQAFVRRGEKVQIPPPEAGFRFPVKPPHGETFVKAIATLKPLTLSGVTTKGITDQKFMTLDRGVKAIGIEGVSAPVRLGAGGNLHGLLEPADWATAELVIITQTGRESM